MGREALLEALEEDARIQCESIVSEARGAAEAMVASARKAAGEARAARMKEAASALEKKRTAALLEARIRAEGVKLKARREMIGCAIARAVEQISGMPREDYARMLNGFIEEIRAEARRHGCEGGELAVRVNPADAGLVSSSGVKALADPEVELGAVYESDDHRFRFENTVRSRVRSASDELEALVNRELFKDGE